ncbi:acyloxyacyl hydrolase [Kaistella sp.]|uniref:acyloxyacyl hydrolase n=1 Tax=Kaistella sp. TaxID=2782235 RepID=UPI003C3EB254
MKIKFILTFTILVSFFLILNAQDNRSQIPVILQKSYFEVNAGSIDYSFSDQHLESGYTMNSVSVPHWAARIVLFGYDFNRYLSAQITYMRPVYWVRYNYTNHNKPINQPNAVSGSGSVRMNIGALTLKPKLPVNDKLSVYGEAGLGIITRHGFVDKLGKSVVNDASYASVLLGLGIKYHLNDKWALQIQSNYTPENAKVKQPATSFIGTGFSYNFVPFTEERLQKTKELGYIYPKQWIQIGMTNNFMGYGINNAVSSKYLPIFWGGHAEVKNGLSIIYQRNIFHGAKVFALDWGINASGWETNVNNDKFFTLSIFPAFRLNYLHAKDFDAYFYYSVAAPTYISETILDGHKMGGKFTFMDNMGTGAFFGSKRNLNAELKIGHYSNGNIFTDNEAVKIPLSLSLGYAF